MNKTFDLIEKAIRRDKNIEMVPLYEHFADDEVIEEIMGFKFTELDDTYEGQFHLFVDETVPEEKMGVHIKQWEKRLNFYKQLGYVYLPVEFPPLFSKTEKKAQQDTAIYSRGTREWIDEHNGIIKSPEDFDDTDKWPGIDKIFDYKLFENISNIVPDEMKIIGGFAGGPFEHSMYLLGTENLFTGLYDNKDLVKKLYDKLYESFTGITKRLIKNDKLRVFRIGDDLGFKMGTLVSPELIRKYIFPIYKKIIEITHNEGKTFILHSCGNLKEIMDDLIDYCKIDAKHSFEDVIMPIEEVKKIWGDRVALLGGIDVDFLCRSTTKKIKEKTKKVLEICSKNGGYAMGTGNTPTNYMPVKNYLAMIEATNEFNGEHDYYAVTEP